MFFNDTVGRKSIRLFFFEQIVSSKLGIILFRVFIVKFLN